METASPKVECLGARLQVLFHWLATSELDVACLQEREAAGGGFPAEALRKAGHEATWRGRKAWDQRDLPGDPDDAHGRCLEAVAGGITIGRLHRPEATRPRGRRSTSS